MPRAATSVTTSTSVFLARNLPMFSLRAAKSIVPYTEEHAMPSDSSTVTRSSTWCLVAANTTVCCFGGTTSRSTYSSAGIFSSTRTTVKESFRSGLTFISASRRITCGSRRPTRTNSASAVGMVAEKRSVWRISATSLRMSRSWSLKPISSRRSASSRHTIVTLRMVNPSTSSTMCSRRPGVATIRSGFPARSENCASMESPPTTHAARKSVNLSSSCANLNVCSASSRVGESTTARAPALSECCRSLCSMGMRNAAVLPEPVRAMATTSAPASATGMAFRWMGVGMR